MANTKYEERLKKFNAEQQRENERFKGELGDFTFRKAKNGWSRTFKKLENKPEQFDAQHKICRMLQEYFTEDEWSKVPIYTLEEKLLAFIADELETLLNDKEKYNKCLALNQFITYINDKQTERYCDSILITAWAKINSLCAYARRD